MCDLKVSAMTPSCSTGFFPTKEIIYQPSLLAEGRR
jgi:hypothetical protein